MSSIFNIPLLLSHYGYIGVFIIVLLESGIIFALPGDSLLFTAGLLASTAGLNLFFLIPLIFIATFLGGMAGYGIGRYLETLNRYAFFRKILKKEYIDEAHIFFERRGKAAIILSRFVPIMRTFTPIVAGVARMKKATFIRYSLISSFLWATIVTLLGYFLGQAFPSIKNYLDYFVFGVIAVSLIPVVLSCLRKRSRRNQTR
jgi:membrane-associated protein